MKNIVTSIITHVRSWGEIYGWTPFALLLIPATELLYYLATGRHTTDDPWLWIIGYAPKFYVSIMCVVLGSITKQQSGIWLTKQEQLQNPQLAIHKGYQQCAVLFIFAYIWLH